MDATLHKAPIFPFSQDTCIESESESESERGRQRGRQREGGPRDTSFSTVPPYWQHHRYESYTSVDVTRPPAIILEDHTETETECSNPLWAKAAFLEDYVMVSGSFASVGDYIVWSCKIDTLDCFTSLSVDLGWVDNHQKKVNPSRFDPPCALTQWLQVFGVPRSKKEAFDDLSKRTSGNASITSKELDS
ncbi:PX domain-containing protein ypt35 [Sticta canariensis]|nr:PX domain-containing protein ypt35 [Sticta canariensis]